MPASNESIDDLMMLVISSERMAIGCLLQGARSELVPQPLEAAPDAPVEKAVTDSHDDAAQQGRVDGGLERDLPACQLLEAGGDRPDLVGSQGGGTRRGGVGQSIAFVIEPPEFDGDAWQLLDPAAPDEQQDEVADGSAQRGEDLLSDGHALLERDRRVGEDALQLAGRRGRGGGLELLAPRIDRTVTQGDLERGVGVAARGGVASGHQLLEPPAGPLVSARKSETRRFSRSPVMVSPTTLPAARRARSATSLRTSEMARTFSDSISAAARSRIRSRSAFVAAMSASRVSWATFCARARISFASRRAPSSAPQRSHSALSRSRRACSASRSPSSIRALRSVRIFAMGLNANFQMIARNRTKLAAAMITWNRLIWNNASVAFKRTASCPALTATERRSTMASPCLSAAR